MSQLPGQTLNTVIEFLSAYAAAAPRERDRARDPGGVSRPGPHHAGGRPARAGAVSSAPRDRKRLINGFCRIMAGLAPAIPFLAAGKGGPGSGPWATRMDIPT